MDGIVPTFDNAMLFASAVVSARQHGNALDGLQASDAAYLDATTATGNLSAATTGTHLDFISTTVLASSRFVSF